jgi:hypothetical protein
VHVAQASGADIDPHHLAIDDHRSLLGIELPLPIGAALGVANIVPKLRPLATNIAFPRHA